MGELAYIVIGGVLWNNIVLTQLLGLFPFFGERPQTMGENGVLGLVTTLVMVIVVAAGWVVDLLVLQPLELHYLGPMVLILLLLLIAGGLEAAARVVQVPRVPSHLMVRVLLNSAVFGVVLLQLRTEPAGTLPVMLAATLGFGLGVTVLLIVMEAISARPETNLVPRWVRGMPLQFLTLGLIALAMNGLAGI